MSEPPILPAEPPRPPAPFGDQPVEPRSGGCSKPALIGCGVVFLLLGIAGLVFVLKAKNLLVWSLEKVEEGIAANLPPDATAADRERFSAAFVAAKARIEEGRIDPAALQSLQRELMQAVQQPRGQLTRQQLLELTAALERVGAIAPAVEEGPATPVPEPVPESAPETPPPGRGSAGEPAPTSIV